MTRGDALNQLQAFVSHMPDYAVKRGGVAPGHVHVSRLSAAIRYRLITEDEVAKVALDEHDFSTVEKFVQEVYWRLYWKSWLELRPQVWSAYHSDFVGFGSGAHQETEKVLGGNSGIEIFDYFADELITTGYLHNHSRMWFASMWIHEFKLPWQLGAEFFHQYLLDGDSASNTLSWRWVAGLHTTGKNYLARAANIEKYVASEILKPHRGGLDRLRDPKAASVSAREVATPLNMVQNRSLQGTPVDFASTGLWVHPDDLSPESALLKSCTRIVVVVPDDVHDRYKYSRTKREWIAKASMTTAERLGNTAEVVHADDTAVALLDWARSHKLESIVAYQPWVGPLQEALPNIETQLVDGGVKLHLLTKSSDRVWLPLATGGFFGFWKKLQKRHPLLRGRT